MSWDLWASVAAVLGLIIISALFSAAETGITAASKARIHRLAREGSIRAGHVEGLLGRRETLIGSALVGNNIVNILASTLTSYALIRVFGEAGVLYATLVLSILIIVFAEVLPKTYAINRPDQVALTLGPLLESAARLITPLIIAIQRLTQLALKAAHIGMVNKTPFLSPTDEIRGHIDLHAGEGGIVREHKHMLGSILDLDDVLVADVMVHRKTMEMIDADLPVATIIRAAVRSSHTRLPLYRDNPDNIVGILHSKDLLRALNRRGAAPATIQIERILSQPWFIPNTTTLKEQLSAFIAKHSHFALVVDEYGALQGLVTLEDILEEIVGDISDEHDLPTPAGVSVYPDGSLTIEGAVTLRDLNRRFDWSLPDGEATTIAGLLINEARIIPVKGQSFTFYGFRFDVLERRRNQITLLRLTPPPNLRAQ